MSRIKRDFSEKMLSRHHYFEVLEYRSAGLMVKGLDAFFQYSNTPILQYRAV